MDFFEKNKRKLIIVYCVFAISIFTYVLFANLNEFVNWIVFLSLIAPYLAYDHYQTDQRVIDLKEYSEKNNFDFFAKPEKVQISIFKEFKSAKIISNEDRFSNLLVPKNNNDTQPLIVTSRSQQKKLFGESDFNFTQIFLYKLNIGLPKFFIQRKSRTDILVGENRDYVVAREHKLEVYKFKDKKFPHNKYFFFSEDSNVENVINDEFIELLNIGIKRKKALINIESNGKNVIFYEQWSTHSIELMDFYSNLFKVLKESLIK